MFYVNNLHKTAKNVTIQMKAVVGAHLTVYTQMGLIVFVNCWLVVTADKMSGKSMHKTINST